MSQLLFHHISIMGSFSLFTFEVSIIGFMATAEVHLLDFLSLKLGIKNLMPKYA